MSTPARHLLVLLVLGALILAWSPVSPAQAVAGSTGVHLVLPDAGITVNITTSPPTTVRVVVPTSLPGPPVTALPQRAGNLRPAEPTAPVRLPEPTITAPAQAPSSSPAPTASAPTPSAPAPDTTTTPAPHQTGPTPRATIDLPTDSPGDRSPAPPLSPSQDLTVRPAPAPSAGVVREPASGLPWKSGVFGNHTEHVVRYQAQTGRAVDIIGVFPQRDSWDTIFQDWWLRTAPPGFAGTLDVAVPLWPENGTLAAAAGGEYDEKWVRLGRMIENTYPGSSVRIGWEMNLGSWHYAATEDTAQEWVTAFQRASTHLKKGGPSLQVVWGPNAGVNDALADATRAWPGDAFVDIVGLSDYDWWPAITSAQTAQEVFTGPQELKWWIAFAAEHGKPFALNEYGPAPGNPNAGGDNPVYIEQIMKVLRETEATDPGRIHAVVYFDEDEAFMSNSIAFGQVPLVAAEMRTQMHQTEAQFGNRGLRGQAPAPQRQDTPQHRAVPSQTRVPATFETASTSRPTSPAVEGWTRPEGATEGPTPEG